MKEYNKKKLEKFTNEKEIEKTIGENLKLIRKHRGYTQSNLGDCFSMKFQNWQKKEKATNTFSLARAVHFCKVMNVSLDELAGLKEIKKFKFIN